MRREFFATTKEEALQRASEKLGIPKEELRAEAVKGPFGGALVDKKVAILVDFDESSVVRKDDHLNIEIDRLKSDLPALSQFVLQTILDKLSLETKVEMQAHDDQIILVVDFKGETLDTRRGDIRELRVALQYLLNRMMNNGGDQGKRYIIDFGGELQQRTQTMSNLSKFLSSKIKGLDKAMRIKLMDAQDRRLLHLALVENLNVSSFSQGEGRFRVLCLKKKDEE